jgi:hypothetical protein
MLFISNQSTSPFDDLELKWPRQGELPLYVSVLIVADTAVLISDPRVEGDLLQRLVRPRTGPPIGKLFYRSGGGVLHNLFTERIAFLAFDVLKMLTLEVGMRRENAVGGVGTEHIKIAVLKPTLSLLNISSAFALSCFTAATAFSSMALASSEVPYWAAQLVPTAAKRRSATKAASRNMVSSKSPDGGTETSANYLMGAMFR